MIKYILLSWVCWAIGHDWRTPTNTSRTCVRCQKTERRAFYNWDEWVDENK